MEQAFGTQNGLVKRDSKNRKTYGTLVNMLFVMLNKRNFSDITVNDLCTEASISRSTFYSHFNDKYDLFRCFLTEVKESVVKDVRKYDELEHEVNAFVNQNKRVIINVMRDANIETLSLIREFFLSIVTLWVKRKVVDERSQSYINLTNFLVGGLINQLSWMVENNFPPGVNMMSMYLYQLLEAVTIWDAEQELSQELPDR